MKIIKVVVEELPEMFAGATEVKAEIDIIVTAKSQSGATLVTNRHRYDIPVEVEEVCEFLNMPKDEYGYIYSKTSCGYTFEGVYHEFIYCPNCGKKIEYVEELDNE